MQPLKKLLFALAMFLLSTLIVNTIRAQAVTDTLLSQIRYRYEAQEGYTLTSTIKSVNTRKDGLPPDVETACFTGKEMLVVAVFGAKPQKLFARMLVGKHYSKRIDYDEHLFQDAAFDKSLGAHFSLVRVQFPAEANKRNCTVNLQVYDKANPAAKVWLMIFSK